MSSMGATVIRSAVRVPTTKSAAGRVKAQPTPTKASITPASTGPARALA
ncbi:hypothetical protein [Mycobacterium ulcerans]|nr:hypothetical protein [Mycobacterium ulcerans]